MELKEYIKIVKESGGLFLGVVFGIVLIGLGWYFMAPENYKVETNLNITRNGKQEESNDYRYDEFYRLQADERFADTVVRWLGSERIKSDICKKNNLCQQTLRAKRLSSQFIIVSFVSQKTDVAKTKSTKIINILNKETERLNKLQQSETWFKVLGDEPIITKNKISFQKLLAMLFSSGIFIGFWVVFIRHYFKTKTTFPILIGK